MLETRLAALRELSLIQIPNFFYFKQTPSTAGEVGVWVLFAEAWVRVKKLELEIVVKERNNITFLVSV